MDVHHAVAAQRRKRTAVALRIPGLVTMQTNQHGPEVFTTPNTSLADVKNGSAVEFRPRTLVDTQTCAQFCTRKFTVTRKHRFLTTCVLRSHKKE